jgi:predicted metal-binding protein
MQKLKVVPFKAGEGISHTLTQRLLEKGRSYGLNAIFPFNIEKIAVAEWVHLKCRYGCNQYNTNWCCPPATPHPDKVRAILSEYSTALLLVGTTNCSDFYLNNERKRISQVRCWKGTISLERMLFLEGYYKAFSLVGECCAKEKRPSVESFSIDVIGTLKNLGTTSEVATKTCETYSYYGIILLE